MNALIRGHRKGGNVAHLLRTVEGASVCGRVMAYVPGGEGLRLCKTCARITRVAMDIDTRAFPEIPELSSLPALAPEWAAIERDWLKNADSFTMGNARDVLSAYRDNPSEYDMTNAHTVRLLAKYRAYLKLHTGADFLDPTDTVAPSKDNGNRNGGMVNPNSTTRARQMGATANQRAALMRQAAFVDSLFSQLFEIQGKSDDGATQTARYEKDGFFDSLTRDQIDKEFKGNSALIDRLKLEIEKAKQEAPKPALPSASLTVGLGDICKYEGELYKIKVSQAGRPYALKWDTDTESWDYDSARGVIRKLTPEHLATAEDAAQFGHLYHRCVFCSRPLAKDESEAVGYGPDCAEKRGLPWG